MIPNPITELNLEQSFHLQQIKTEIESKGYEPELVNMIVSLVKLNLIKDSNMRQLIKYCAEKDMGMVK